MAHELLYQVGDWVMILQDKHSAKKSHGAAVNSTHRITQAVMESRTGNKPKDSQEYQLSNGSWVEEDEIELSDNKN